MALEVVGGWDRFRKYMKTHSILYFLKKQNLSFNRSPTEQSGFNKYHKENYLNRLKCIKRN